GVTGVKPKVGGYSRGMKQRLGIAQAFINNPVVLFMDEPTSALDPIGRKEVLDMIESLSEKKTVFFSTHILADVERVCDRVAIVKQGTLVAEGKLSELKEAYTRPLFEIVVDRGSDVLASSLKDIPWMRSVEVRNNEVVAEVSDVSEAQLKLPAAVAATGLPLRRLELKEITLEEIFVDMMGTGSAQVQPAAMEKAW
ncbi:MAG: ABC transporter ATP-binding protein, partial [Chloroflexi bacterium]|nr:ABC transporter ATP-binding protein [Chloroflexota bacterium]